MRHAIASSLIVPMQSCGTRTSDDRSSYLENPRSVGAESSLMGRRSSPSQTETRQDIARKSTQSRRVAAITSGIMRSLSRPQKGRVARSHGFHKLFSAYSCLSLRTPP